ncbi:MAG: D-alanyl-D-alanine carboxypeptidase [Moraxellaceae bacterium]|nr:D-alanyl-D-alanine carboxypeptidase [Pseudobdellovibrionaceae bacterium]
MKNTILKFLVICLMTQSYGANSFAQDYAGPLDLDKLQTMVDSGQLSDDQYNNYVDLIESGGETALMQPSTERVFENDIDAALAADEGIKDIGAATNIDELQKFSDKQVVGYGDWGFQFIYISKVDGSRKVLSSRNANNPVRPASTMKLFTTNLAYDLGTYTNVSNLSTLLQHSRNGMADQALKSTTTALQFKNFPIPSDSYLKSPSLLGYKMYDSTEGKSQIIDATILKGCAIMKEAYKNLEDSSKFHPVNGSGMQATEKDSVLQENKVTPRLETALLERILSNKKKYDTYKTFLPTPGGVGTLSVRFKSGRKLAKIYAKTGTLGNTKALAGFAETDRGTIVFSVIGDRLKGMGVEAAMKGPIENLVFAHIQYIKTQEAKASAKN